MGFLVAMSQVFFFPNHVSVLPHHFVLCNTMFRCCLLALCNLLTFTALPTSFPHSPPLMQFLLCSSLLNTTPFLFPLTRAKLSHYVGFGAGRAPNVLYVFSMFMGHLPPFFCVRVDCPNSKSRFISGLLTWLTLVSERFSWEHKLFILECMGEPKSL